MLPHMPWPWPLLLIVVILWLFPLSAELRSCHLELLAENQPWWQNERHGTVGWFQQPEPRTSLSFFFFYLNLFLTLIPALLQRITSPFTFSDKQPPQNKGALWCIKCNYKFACAVILIIHVGTICDKFLILDCFPLQSNFWAIIQFPPLVDLCQTYFNVSLSHIFNLWYYLEEK